jgi:hypothetical protein
MSSSSSCWRLTVCVVAAGDARAEAGRRGASGRRPEERARAAAGLGAPRGSCQRQEVAPAELQRRPAAVLLRGRGGAEEEEGGGAQGADVKLQKFQGPQCETRFSHCFISQIRKWSKQEL